MLTRSYFDNRITRQYHSIYLIKSHRSYHHNSKPTWRRDILYKTNKTSESQTKTAPFFFRKRKKRRNQNRSPAFHFLTPVNNFLLKNCFNVKYCQPVSTEGADMAICLKFNNAPSINKGSTPFVSVPLWHGVGYGIQNRCKDANRRCVVKSLMLLGFSNAKLDKLWRTSFISANF